MSSAYEAAMTKERERLKAAQKRNFEYSQRDLDEEEVVEDAWGRVFEAGASQIPDEAADAKRRRLEKKAEKRASKRAHEAANAGNWSVYVSGIPKDLSYTAVHSLFSKVALAATCRLRPALSSHQPNANPGASASPQAGEVRRVKLYKDSSGNQKGDGLVTFGSEAAVRAALERDDWQLFGEMLTVQPATFTEKPTVAREEWARIVVLCGLFSQQPSRQVSMMRFALSEASCMEARRPAAARSSCILQQSHLNLWPASGRDRGGRRQEGIRQ
eukprot:2019545-Pleurochrysis_carterae.AAC.6